MRENPKSSQKSRELTRPARPSLRLLDSDPERAVERSLPDRTSSRRAKASHLRFRSPAQDIRLKILSLVLLSALAPALVVGMASYLTARSIVNDKVSDQLSAQALAAAQRASRFFEDRDADTKIFAHAALVSEHLELWTSARRSGDTRRLERARSRSRQYLAQVQERYPLYRVLSIFDSEGALVATTGLGEDPEASPSKGSDSRSSTWDLLVRDDREALFYIRHTVHGSGDHAVGSLVAGSSLEELWRTQGSESLADRVKLRAIAAGGRVLFDTHAVSGSETGALTSEGARRCIAGENGIAEYLDERGVPVLGAYRYLSPVELGFLAEIEAQEAYSASRRLWNFNLLTSLLAAILVTGIGSALVLSLTRPIEALIRGAKAAADGDLSQQIPVSSGDQIGYLTTVFNQMTRNLLDSRSRLEMISSTDELTDLPNRRHLAKTFRVELSRAGRTGHPLSVLIIDFDHFKRFNDRFGHLQGDSLLREASRYLAENLRPTDILARFGGEEFVVLLPDTDKERATELAERLRLGFAEANARADEANPWVTISVGVASWPEDGDTREALLHSADLALYRAKHQGRNQVQVAV